MTTKGNAYDEGSLRFNFPTDWRVSQYDKTAFYRNKLEKIKLGNMGDRKAVDFVAQAPDGALWLIEVKDFRGHRIENKNRITSGGLVDEVVAKSLDTLAGLWLAHHQQDAELVDFTHSLKPDRPVYIVLWLEEDQPASRLNPRQKSQVDIEDLLRKRVKPIGLKAMLGRMSSKSEKIHWTTCNNRA